MRAPLLGLLLGLLTGFFGARVMRPVRSGAPSTEFWLADRDAHRLVGLDRELGRRREIELSWPSRVCPTHDRGTWVASAPGRGLAEDPHAPWRLFRIDERGELRGEFGLPGLRDLRSDRRGGAWALWGEPPRLARLEEGVRPIELPAGARRIATSERWIVIGFDGGEVLRLDPDGVRPARWRHVGAPVVDLAGSRGGWWVLDEGGVLHRFDEDLVARWAGRPPLEDPRLACAPDGGHVWIVDGARGAAVRVDARGRGWRGEPLPLAGVECARALPDGGLLAAGGGAVVRLDARGRLVVGQGGFAFVADL